MTRDFSKAFSYARTSSATNTDGDSEQRQLDAIARYAGRAKLALVGHKYDGAVSGADDVESRPGFAALLSALRASNVGVVIVEAADRFARDLIVQERGILALAGLGVRLVTASGDDLTDSRDPSRVMVRQILGAVAQCDKARVVAKLKSGRDRVRAATGRCEGPKPAPPAAVEIAKRLRNDPYAPMSLRAIAKRLAAAGYLNPRGRTYAAESIKCMLD